MSAEELSKRIALYSVRICEHYDINSDAEEEPVLMIQAAYDVLYSVYGITDSTPEDLVKIVLQAQDWFSDMYNSIDDDELKYYDTDNQVEDAKNRLALRSGPSLKAINMLPCNESDMGSAPRPFISCYDHDMTCLMKAAYKRHELFACLVDELSINKRPSKRFQMASR